MNSTNRQPHGPSVRLFHFSSHLSLSGASINSDNGRAPISPVTVARPTRVATIQIGAKAASATLAAIGRRVAQLSGGIVMCERCFVMGISTSVKGAKWTVMGRKIAVTGRKTAVMGQNRSLRLVPFSLRVQKHRQIGSLWVAVTKNFRR